MNPMFHVAVRETPGQLVFLRPAWTFALRGGLLMVVAPFSAIVGVLFLDMSPELGAMIGAGVAGTVLLLGLGFLVLSPLLARRGRLVVDTAAGRLTTSAGLTVELRSIAGLRVTRGATSAQVIAAASDGTTTTLMTGGSALAPGLGRVAERLGALTGAPVEGWDEQVEERSRERRWASACYLPIEGIFLFASVAALLGSKQPTIRFAAKQSLLQLALFVALLTPALVIGGGAAALGPEALRLPIGLGLGAVLFALFVWNVVTRLVASYRAYHGRAWLIPWLAPIARRWAPNDGAAN